MRENSIIVIQGLSSMYHYIDPLYCWVLIILILLVYWIQFKIRNPFWSHQPVSYCHHFYRTWFEPHVIKPDLYVPTFMNIFNIKTLSWSSLDDKIKKIFTSHINDHYWKMKKENYSPSLKGHIAPYYDNDVNAHISLYYLNNIMVGTIANRTLRIHLKDISFDVAYIDYLCVHKGYRKKRVAPELIQTHEHFQRTKSSKKCLVSLFKKEGKLHSFIPLVKYLTYTYDMRSEKSPFYTVDTPSFFFNKYDIIPGSLSCLKDILIFIHSVRLYFSCFILPPIEILKQLIERKSIIVYCLIEKSRKQVCGIYFFRPTGIYMNSSKENIECFASLFDKEICDTYSDFFFGFLSSLKKIKEHYCHLQIEMLGHNTILNDFLKSDTKEGWCYKYKTQCAYYLYNYSHEEITPETTCILLG